MSSAVSFTEKNKRVVSNCSVQNMQLEEQWKKIFLPSFPHPLHLCISQLSSSQPSELEAGSKMHSKMVEATGNTVDLVHFTYSS